MEDKNNRKDSSFAEMMKEMSPEERKAYFEKEIEEGGVERFYCGKESEDMNRVFAQEKDSRQQS